MALIAFDEIIDFAIQREREAVRFYQELQGMARFAAQTSLMKEFESMEQGHVILLQNVRKRKTVAGLNPEVPNDLKLNEFLVEAPPAPEMTYQDILITAIKREERSTALYSRLLTEATDPEIKLIFKQLKTEEEKHKHHFEFIYDRDIQSEN